MFTREPLPAEERHGYRPILRILGVDESSYQKRSDAEEIATKPPRVVRAAVQVDGVDATQRTSVPVLILENSADNACPPAIPVPCLPPCRTAIRNSPLSTVRTTTTAGSASISSRRWAKLLVWVCQHDFAQRSVGEVQRA